MNTALIKNGLVCFEDGIRQSDIIIRNGKIESFNSDNNADEVLDASGCYVLPGMIDIHTHLDDTIGKYYLADTYKTGSEIAVLNGITTLFNFITQGKNESLNESVEKATKKAKGNLYSNIGWHLTPTVFNEEDWKHIKDKINNGFKTIKLYTTYKNAGIFTDYDKLDKVFGELKEYDVTFLIHCEDNDVIEEDLLNNYDLSKPFTHALLRPKIAEFKAIRKVIEIAKKNNAKLHIVHVSTCEGIDLINDERKNLKITCETAPHYLFLNDEYLKKEDGYKWICSPPLRDKKNMNDMQKKAREGLFDIFATDHCAFERKHKDEMKKDIRNVPNGLAGIGALPHLIFKLYSDNFNNAFSEMCKRLSENPAKISGLYPSKGVLKAGSDADLAVISPDGAEREIKSSLSDVYETYPGFKTKLSFKYVFLNGEIIVKNDKLINEKNTGKIIT
ncbi:MAG: amidohydrolase family protein [Ignavibacteriae bacterium]|nr:amidohydrolase family protein [Ignavibacteriota bacterium]